MAKGPGLEGNLPPAGRRCGRETSTSPQSVAPSRQRGGAGKRPGNQKRRAALRAAHPCGNVHPSTRRRLPALQVAREGGRRAGATLTRGGSQPRDSNNGGAVPTATATTACAHDWAMRIGAGYQELLLGSEAPMAQCRKYARGSPSSARG